MAAVGEKAKGKRSRVKEPDESNEDFTKFKKRKTNDCDEHSASSSDVQDCENMREAAPMSDDDASCPDNAGASSPESDMICVSLPEDEQLVAIDYLKKHRFMWDSRDTDYRMKLRYGYWFILGAKFGCTHDEMVKWYQTFRLRYFNIKVERSMHMQTRAAPPHLTQNEQLIWDNGKFLDHDPQQ